MVNRSVRTWIQKFDTSLTLAATAGDGGWAVKDTSSAGTPTYLTGNADGGELNLTLANTNESELITLYQLDLLSLPVGAGKLHWLYWIVKCSVDALSVLSIGAGTAAVHSGNEEDDVVSHAWFKIEGAASTSALVLETDDGTTDNNDKSSGGATLGSTYKKLAIDFTRGLSDLRFYCDGAPVGRANTFSVAALASNIRWQPMIQLSKPSGTGTPSVSVAEFGCRYSLALGA